MTKLSRRDFLKVLGLGTAGIGAILATSCAANEQTGGQTGSTANTNNTDAETIANEGSASNVTTDTQISDEGVTKTEDGKTMVTCAWDTLLTTLTPIQSVISPKQAIQYEVLETLMARDSKFQMYPSIAKGYEQADEAGYKWSVELFDYVHDSEGNHINADDVIFCIDEVIKSGIVMAKAEEIVNVTKTGDYSFEVEFKTDFYGTVQSFLAYMPIFSRKAYEESGDSMATQCVCTGPYKVVDFVNSASLTTEAVEDYWQTDETYRNPFNVQNVDRIHKVFITENSQREVLLETGEVNMVYNIDTSSVKQFEGNNDILYRAETSRLNFCIVLSARGPFKDKRLRQAVAYAVDELAIIDAAYDGYGYKINHGLIYSDDYNHEWDQEEYYSYNPEKAKELIKEAGAEGTHLVFMTTASAGPAPEFIQAYLNDVGFDCEIKMLELAGYMSNYYEWETYDLTTSGMGGTTSVEFYNALYKTDENGVMVTGFNDPELNELIKIAGSTNGHTVENMEKMHDYAVEQCYRYTPWTFCQVNMWRADSGIVDTVLDYNLAPRLGSCTYIWNK